MSQNTDEEKTFPGFSPPESNPPFYSIEEVKKMSAKKESKG
jgi:hypothetical protein